MNLTEILNKLADLDDASEEIVPEDAAQIVGDLADKIDAIRVTIRRLEGEEMRLCKDAQEILAAASQVRRNCARLESYLLFAMRAQGYQKLPGKIFRAQIQKSAPALKIDREAGAGDMLLFGENMVKRDVTYAWRKDPIKKLIADGGKFEHGRLVQGEYVKFYVSKGQKDDAE